MATTIELIEELKEFEDQWIKTFEKRKEELEISIVKEKENMIMELLDTKNKLLKEKQEKIELDTSKVSKQVIKDIDKYEGAKENLDKLFKKNQKQAIELATKRLFL